MAHEPVIRRFQREDEATAVQLLVDRIPPPERPAAYEKRLVRWRWQYYQNPANPGREPVIWVADAGGRVVGVAGTVPVSLKTPKGILPALWALDLVVDPVMRGRGLGKKLMTKVVNMRPVSLGRGWRPVALRVDLSVGLNLVWGFTTAELVISPFRFAANSLRRKHYRDILRLAGAILSSRWRHRREQGATVLVSRTVPEGTDDLWTAIARAYRLCVVRDREYLGWRFASHPSHTYHFVHTAKEGKLTGVVVCRLTDDDPPMGIISDLLVPPGHDRSVIGLLESALLFLESRGAYSVSVDLPPALSAITAGSDGLWVRKPLGILVRSLDSDLARLDIYNADRWYISRSDSDEDY
jgi:GNAT superfamily N-acetyltransferase